MKTSSCEEYAKRLDSVTVLLWQWVLFGPFTMLLLATIYLLSGVLWRTAPWKSTRWVSPNSPWGCSQFSSWASPPWPLCAMLSSASTLRSLRSATEAATTPSLSPHDDVEPRSLVLSTPSPRTASTSWCRTSQVRSHLVYQQMVQTVDISTHILPLWPGPACRDVAEVTDCPRQASQDHILLFLLYLLSFFFLFFLFPVCP